MVRLGEEGKRPGTWKPTGAQWRKPVGCRVPRAARPDTARPWPQPRSQHFASFVRRVLRRGDGVGDCGGKELAIAPTSRLLRASPPGPAQQASAPLQLFSPLFWWISLPPATPSLSAGLIKWRSPWKRQAAGRERRGRQVPKHWCGELQYMQEGRKG